MIAKQREEEPMKKYARYAVLAAVPIALLLSGGAIYFHR